MNNASKKILIADDHDLLRDVLRQEMGFKGFVISDAFAVQSLENHGFAADNADAAARPVRLEPPQNGSILRIVEFPPDKERNYGNQAEVFSQYGAAQAHDGAYLAPLRLLALPREGRLERRNRGGARPKLLPLRFGGRGPRGGRLGAMQAVDGGSDAADEQSGAGAGECRSRRREAAHGEQAKSEAGDSERCDTQGAAIPCRAKQGVAHVFGGRRE